MMILLRERVARHRASCRRVGHTWSDRCHPVACGRCGVTRRAAGALDESAGEQRAA